MPRSNTDRPLHRPQFSVDPRSAGEAIKRISVFQEKHEGFGKILASAGRCVIGDEMIPKPPRSHPLHRLFRSASARFDPIPSTLGKPFFPTLVGPRLAIAIRRVKHRFEPSLSEKVAIQVVPRMSEFMPDDVGQGASGCSGLGGKITGQVDHAGTVSLVAEWPRLLKHIPRLPGAPLTIHPQFDMVQIPTIQQQTQVSQLFAHAMVRLIHFPHGSHRPLTALSALTTSFPKRRSFSPQCTFPSAVSQSGSPSPFVQMKRRNFREPPERAT